MSPGQASAAIARAGEMLLNPMTPHGLALRQAVAQRQGHHPEIIERGLQDTLSQLESQLDALARSRPDGPTVESQAIVLAGNVFTLAFRPVAIALLAGVPTRIKPASPGDPFSEFFWSALTQADPEIGGLIEVMRFSSDDVDALDAFLANVEHVAVYGGQVSIDSISSRLDASQRLSVHGPGFGAIVLEEADLIDLGNVAEAIAHDIIAYDQAGCLSPHVVWFDGSLEQARGLCEALNVALDERANSLAHQLDTDTAIAALRWRASALQDEFFGDPRHALWLRRGASFEPSPGHRHISVCVCSAQQCQEVMAEVGPLLKAIASTTGELGRLVVNENTPPRISTIGSMQSPPLDEIWDGRSLWAELFR